MVLLLIRRQHEGAENAVKCVTYCFRSLVGCVDYFLTVFFNVFVALLITFTNVLRRKLDFHTHFLLLS